MKGNLFTHDIYRAKPHKDGYMILGNTSIKINEDIELIDGMLPKDYVFYADYDIDWDIYFDDDFNMVHTEKLKTDKLNDNALLLSDTIHAHALEVIASHVKKQRLMILLGEYPEQTESERFHDMLKNAKVTVLDTPPSITIIPKGDK